MAFDALALAREHGTEANASCSARWRAAGPCRCADAAFREAIERKGVAVKSNLAGFELGLALVRDAADAGSAHGDADEHAGPSASAAGLPADLRALVEAMPRRRP